MTLTKENTPTLEASPADLEGVTQAITDYMECWYGVGHEKLPQAIHPTIVKRVFRPNPDTGNSALRQVTASQLVETAKVSAQRDNLPPDQWRNDITIYDVFQNIATAKSVGSFWTDYLHLAKLDGRWQIMHILFDNPREDVPEADPEAIHQTILDYMESWYSYEHDRLERAFHPALVKRGFYPHGQSGNIVISVSPVSRMIENLRAASMKKKPRPKEQWVADITIYDVYQGIATAKSVGDGWVDYLHLADVNGEWKIINIFYDRPS